MASVKAVGPKTVASVRCARTKSSSVVEGLRNKSVYSENVVAWYVIKYGIK